MCPIENVYRGIFENGTSKSLRGTVRKHSHDTFHRLSRDSPETSRIVPETFWRPFSLAHQNRTVAIASDFRVDGAKSPEIPQKEGVLGSEIAARNRRSLATFHRTLKSQCSIAFSSLGDRAISGVRDGHRNRKSQKIVAISVTGEEFHGLLHFKAGCWWQVAAVQVKPVLQSRLWSQKAFRSLR